MTPCRRVGLSKTPNRPCSTPKFEPKASRSFQSEGRDGSPISSHTQLSKKRPSGLVSRFNDGAQASTDTMDTPFLFRLNSNTTCTPSTRTEIEDCINLKSSMELGVDLANGSAVQAKRQKVSSVDIEPTTEDLITLRRRVALKEKHVKELRQAQVICKKHNSEELTDAVGKWRKGCQNALQELWSIVNCRGQTIGMEKLLSELGIPSTLVQYNTETEEFE